MTTATAAEIAGQRVLVTGAAGFIGMHTARALLDAGRHVDRRRQLRSVLRRVA